MLFTTEARASDKIWICVLNITTSSADAVFDGSKQYNEKSQNRIIPRISGEAPQNGLKWKLALTYISRT